MTELIRQNLPSVIAILLMAVVVMTAVPLVRKRLQQRGEDHSDLIRVIERGQRAFFAVVLVATARLVLVNVDDGEVPIVEPLERFTGILFIIVLVWLLIEVLLGLEAVILDRYAPIDRISRVEVRKMRTQVILVRRLIVAVVLTIGVASVLMTFPAIRVFGQGLLASAGLISIVAGLAAQSTLTNVFAGVQLTLSNAMRVGDVVSVDGQSGTVGEITLSYVVIHLWDDRRLILPTSHFTSTPYENWTRRGGRINGVIDFDVDWSVPMDALRAELDRVLSETTLWDGRKSSLFVSDITGGRVRIRIIVSAANTDDMFSLSSHVRESMVAFISDQGYAWVPRAREEDVSAPTALSETQ